MAAEYIKLRQRGTNMGRVLFGILLLIAGLIQVSLSPEMWIIDVTPNIALVFLLVWSASRGAEEGLI